MEQMNDPKIIFTPHIMHPACRGGTAAGTGRKNLKSKSLAGSVCVCCFMRWYILHRYLLLSGYPWKEKSTANVLQPLGIFKVHGLFLGALQCAVQTWQFQKKNNGGSCAAYQWLLQSFASWTNQSCCSQAATCSLMLSSFSRIREVRIHDWMDDTFRIHDWMDDTLSNPISHSISYCRAYQFELNIRNVWTPASEPQHAIPVCIVGNRDRRSDSKFQHQDP